MEGLRFDGQVVLVTGAARGLGRAYAELLAARGATLLLNDLPASGLDATAASLRAGGAHAVAVAADLTVDGAPEALVGAALEAHGRLDAVVSNAGIAQHARFGEVPAGLLEQMWNVHVKAPFALAQAAWPVLARAAGSVVLTTSGAGLFGMAENAAYATAKAAVLGMTRSMALDGAAVGVRVNAIAPAAFTPMVEAALPPGEVRDRMQAAMPPMLVAPAVAWLAHPDCPLNGEVVAAVGGRVARVLVGQTVGIFDVGLSVEDVAARWEQIADRTGAAYPADAVELARRDF